MEYRYNNILMSFTLNYIIYRISCSVCINGLIYSLWIAFSWFFASLIIFDWDAKFTLLNAGHFYNRIHVLELCSRKNLIFSRLSFKLCEEHTFLSVLPEPPGITQFHTLAGSTRASPRPVRVSGIAPSAPLASSPRMMVLNAAGAPPGSVLGCSPPPALSQFPCSSCSGQGDSWVIWRVKQDFTQVDTLGSQMGRCWAPLICSPCIRDQPVWCLVYKNYRFMYFIWFLVVLCGKKSGPWSAEKNDVLKENCLC